MRFLVLLSVLGLGGCAASSYCTDEQNYQKARSVAPVKSAEGMQLPESPSALRIPPPPANPVAFGEVYKDAEDDERVRCLDTPPEMPLPPLAPVTEEKPKS